MKAVICPLYTVNLSFVIILRPNPTIVSLIYYFNIKNLPIPNLNNCKLRVNILFTTKLDILPAIAPYAISSFKRAKLKLTLYVRNSLTT